MATDTDIRLRSSLDANQRDREQMCRALLALDPHYSDVRPRHPLGGPDGGRDIEAIHDGKCVAYAAVGFHNGANDANDQKKEIKKKFSADLGVALEAKPDLKVFAFFTNVRFTMGEQFEMKEEARRAGIEHCDVFDRERLRIELDSPSGFFVRFQYLSIPLSEAEQASFLARYGDRIQEVVSTGFQRVEKTLSRILFLQEASNVLGGIAVQFRLKKKYQAAEIGHFRAFVDVYLHAVKYDILRIWFGASDKAERFRTDLREARRSEPSGIKYGISGGQWERHVKLPAELPANGSQDDQSDHTEDDENNDRAMVQVGSSSSVGMDPVSMIISHYSHDDSLFRLRPRLELRDLDECMFIPIVNGSLAERIHSIEVFANSYKVAHIGFDDFKVDTSPVDIAVPDAFTAQELADPWVRIRPSNFSSTFHLRFDERTPRRMFGHDETPDTAGPVHD